MTCASLAKWGYRTNATLVRNTRLDAPVLAHWHEHLGLIRTFLEGNKFLCFCKLNGLWIVPIQNPRRFKDIVRG